MLVKFSGHIDVKFPSIVSKLDSFLLLAKIKGEVALALLAAPSYVHYLLYVFFSVFARENFFHCFLQVYRLLTMI
jgi:hypothetical protein